MRDIPLGASVECSDGPCGASTAVIVNPVTRRLTHIVVEGQPPVDVGQQLVPISLVGDTKPNRITLNCTQSEFTALEGFVSTNYIATPEPDPSAYAGGGYVAPYSSSLTDQPIPHNQENIPAGELAVHRGDRVDAADGHVGIVQEFLVNGGGEAVTHIVVEEERGLGRRLISIPVSEIDTAAGNVVTLRLDRHAVQSLPGIPIKRHYAKDNVQAGQLELVAYIFADIDAAENTLDFLQAQTEEGEHDITIEHAAIVVQDESGEAHIQDIGDLPASRSRLFGVVAGGLTGLIAGPLGAVLGAAAGAGLGNLAAKGVDLGLSDEFLQNLESHLEPANSALVVIVDRQRVDELSGLVCGAKAIILQETLTEETIAQMKQAAQQDMPED